MNNTSLIGRLTKDPELRYTSAGIAVTTFTLAVQRDFKNASGDYETDFIPVVAWRSTAEYVANHFKKGKLAAVTGRIQPRNYENNEGQRIYVTEVITEQVQLLEWGTRTAPAANPNDPFAGDGKPIDISDDDLPF